MARSTSYLTEGEIDRGGRTAFGAIIAGTLVALAVFALLTLLGIGFGFAAVDPTDPDPFGASPTVAPIYLFLSQLVALGAGGFTAGRLAGLLHNVGAALHGVTVWALTTILSIWLASAAVTGAFNAISSALSTVGSGAASAVGAAIPDDFSLPDVSAGALSFDNLPEGVQSTLRQNGITPDNFQAEAREALRNVVSQSEQSRAVDAAQATAAEIARQPGQAGQAVDDFVGQLFGQGGVLSEEDRQEALQVMQSRFGVTEAEAQSFIDQMQARAEEVQVEAEQAIEGARAEIAQTAEQAAEAASTAGFLAFFASLLGLVAAAAGAVLGRVKPYGLPR